MKFDLKFKQANKACPCDSLQFEKAGGSPKKRLTTTHYSLKTNQGFTLIEMLLVIAMIAILASAILVAISAQREKARISKVVLELSGAIQPIMMCFSDGGEINSPPDPTEAICEIEPGTLDSSYGTWPELPADWSYGTFDFSSSASWNYRASSNDDTSTVACNSTDSKCEEQ